MLKIIAIIAAIVIAAILILAATKPDTFRVQRSLSIKAPPEKIYPLINDFHNWALWSPYDKKDLAMKKTYSSNAVGTGATYAWQGDKNVGKGRMEITDSVTPSKIVIALDFFEPFEAHNTAEFSLDGNGDVTDTNSQSTVVTWAMQGPTPYLAKIMHLFFNMDKMVGDDFEIGLANLKTLAEK